MQRWIAAAALVLTVVVTATSAHIRLAQSGLGCEPWPTCHPRNEAHTVDADRFTVARAAHRLSASLVGALVLGLAVLGWSGYAAADRVVVVFALGLVVFLAFLGRATPSPVAAVTLANVQGGLALAGALAWLMVARGRPPGASRTVAIAGVALVTIAFQAALGVLLSVRHAVAACPDLGGCAFALDAALLDPRAATPPMLAEDIASTGRQGLQALHRAWGLATLAMAAAAAVALRCNGGRVARGAGVLLAMLLATEAVLGLVVVLGDAPLVAAVSHNALAALVVATLAGGARASAAGSHSEHPA